MPFAGYKDFAECVEKNKDKKDPEAYCGEIQKRVEKFVKGGPGSGVKGHTTAEHLVPRKSPNPKIMEALIVGAELTNETPAIDSLIQKSKTLAIDALILIDSKR